MTTATLDTRLKEDCYLLGCLGTTQVLLMRNALFPWFILVPETDVIEFYKLDAEFQAKITNQINTMSEFIDNNFQIDKMNIGMIGNIVAQLHIHIVGRNRNDSCWPGVVWGVKQFSPYDPEQIQRIKDKLISDLANIFRASPEIP